MTDRTRAFCTSLSTSDRVDLEHRRVQWLDHNSFPRIENISRTIASHTLGHHLYADDTQLQSHVYQQELCSCLYKIERCVGAIKDWSAKRPIQLNPETNDLVFESNGRLSWLQQDDVSLQFESVVIKPSESVRDIGLACNWMQNDQRVHTTKMVSSYFINLRRLRQFVRSFVHLFVRSLVRSFTRSFVRSFFRSFVRSFVRHIPIDRQTDIQTDNHTDTHIDIQTYRQTDL